MTHEELITSVELAIDEALRTNRYNVHRSRVAAREAIRITGEACAASLNHEATLVTNPILQLAYEASATTILSLTQGNKT
jgi:hypothetical protein